MLIKTEIVNGIMGLGFVVGSYFIWQDAKICLSLMIGSAIGGANFWAIYKIVKGLVGDGKSKIKFAIFAFLKFFILIFVLWAVIKWLPLNVVGFLIGLSTIILSMLCTTLTS